MGKPTSVEHACDKPRRLTSQQLGLLNRHHKHTAYAVFYKDTPVTLHGTRASARDRIAAHKPGMPLGIVPIIWRAAPADVAAAMDAMDEDMAEINAALNERGDA